MKKFLIICMLVCISMMPSIKAAAQNDSTFVFKNAFIAGNKTLVVSLATEKNIYVGIEICDILGNQISLKIIEVFPGSTVKRIDVSNLKPGLYFTSVYEGEETFIKTFVVAGK